MCECSCCIVCVCVYIIKRSVLRAIAAIAGLWCGSWVSKGSERFSSAELLVVVCLPQRLCMIINRPNSKLAQDDQTLLLRPCLLFATVRKKMLLYVSLAAWTPGLDSSALPSRARHRHALSGLARSDCVRPRKKSLLSAGQTCQTLRLNSI